MKTRIRDIISTLGQLIKFYLSFEYQNLIIYVECVPSVSEENIEIKCKWCGENFTESIELSYIEDKYNKLHSKSLDESRIVANNVINIIRTIIGERIYKIYTENE